MSEKKEKYFFCRDCFHSWKTDQYQYDDAETALSVCDSCNTPTPESPHYYFNLPKMMEAQKGKHTGPKTPEGKKRTSMNAFKHGMFTKQKTIIAPAKKDRYPECPDCEFRDTCGIEHKYCPVNLALLTRVAESFESGNIENMKEFAGLMQGNALITLKMLFNDLYANGTLVPHKVHSKVDKAGENEEIVLEWQRNPSLKPIVDFMTMLGFTAEQQMMTPAKKTDDDNVKGYLESESAKNETLNEFTKRTDDKIAQLRNSIIQASAHRANDQILNQFKKENASETDTDNE